MLQHLIQQEFEPKAAEFLILPPRRHRAPQRVEQAKHALPPGVQRLVRLQQAGGAEHAGPLERAEDQSSPSVGPTLQVNGGDYLA